MAKSIGSSIIKWHRLALSFTVQLLKHFSIMSGLTRIKTELQILTNWWGMLLYAFFVLLDFNTKNVPRLVEFLV